MISLSFSVVFFFCQNKVQTDRNHLLWKMSIFPISAHKSYIFFRFPVMFFSHFVFHFGLSSSANIKGALLQPLLRVSFSFHKQCARTGKKRIKNFYIRPTISSVNVFKRICQQSRFVSFIKCLLSFVLVCLAVKKQRAKRRRRKRTQRNVQRKCVVQKINGKCGPNGLSMELKWKVKWHFESEEARERERATETFVVWLL